MFDDMVVSGQIKKTNKPWTVVVSGIVQAFLLGILILIPLISYSELPKGFNTIYLSAPPPPPAAPAPPPLPQLEQRPRVILTRLEAPNHVPTRVVIVNEPEPTVDLSNSGVPSGPGDSSLLSNLLGSSTPVPPPAAKPAARIRVGGVIEAARLTRQTIPAYPKIAQTAHVQGYRRFARDHRKRRFDHIAAIRLRPGSPDEGRRRCRVHMALSTTRSKW